VADYLKRIWEYDSEVQTIAGGAGGVADGIIGVADGGGMKFYDGLCHYMYRHGGKIYSWGREFTSVAEADAKYQVVRLIKIKTA